MPQFATRFQLSREEFARAHRFHLRRSFFTFKTIVVMSFALLLAWMQAQVFGPAHLAGWIFLGIWALILLFMAYAFFLLPPSLYRRRSVYRAEQRLEAGNEGMSLEVEGKRREIPWSGVKDAVANREFILLGLSEAVPIVIPKKAFESEEQWQEFGQFVAGRILASSQDDRPAR